MEQQVRDFIPHLKVGGSYLFEHVRKGPFVGIYRGTTPTRDNDEQDSIFLEIDIITEDGSGQERLANSFEHIEGRKLRPAVSRKLIRPSLLRTISSPSSSARARMTEQFTRIRDEADKRARETASEPTYPVISLPTEKAMSKLDRVDDEVAKKPSWFKRLLGGN